MTVGTRVTYVGGFIDLSMRDEKRWRISCTNGRKNRIESSARRPFVMLFHINPSASVILNFDDETSDQRCISSRGDESTGRNKKISFAVPFHRGFIFTLEAISVAGGVSVALVLKISHLVRFISRLVVNATRQ